MTTRKPQNLREAECFGTCKHHYPTQHFECEKFRVRVEQHEICDDYSPEGEGEAK